MRKLSKPQMRRLAEIAAYRPRRGVIPLPGMFNTPTDRVLERTGMIERVVHEAPLGGLGTIGGAMVKWNLCRITDLGRSALQPPATTGESE